MSRRGEIVEKILEKAHKSRARDAGEFILDILDGLIDPAKRPASKYNPKSKVESAFSKLIKRGLLQLERGRGKSYVRLTPRGRETLAGYVLGRMKIKKQWRWDGKWRVLIFDIREFKKKTRDKLGRTLLQIGFARLQDSVFVCPWECEEVITMIKSYFKLGGEVLYMEVNRIENDRWLREDFELI